MLELIKKLFQKPEPLTEEAREIIRNNRELLEKQYTINGITVNKYYTI